MANMGFCIHKLTRAILQLFLIVYMPFVLSPSRTLGENDLMNCDKYCAFVPVFNNQYPPALQTQRFHAYYLDNYGINFGYSGFVVNVGNESVYDARVQVVAIAPFDSIQITRTVEGSPVFPVTLRGQPNPIYGYLGLVYGGEPPTLYASVLTYTTTTTSALSFVDVGSSVSFSPSLEISPTASITRTATLVNTQPVTITNINVAFYTLCYPLKVLFFNNQIPPGDSISFVTPTCFTPGDTFGWDIFGAQAQLAP